ncbi:MAG: glutathione S-transferase family protein [Pseudomonadota bacterium]
MRKLYHQPVDPFCRKVRLVLAEKGLEAALVEERPWEARAEFAALNPGLKVPVLIDQDPAGDAPVIAESNAIAEYVEEVYGPPRQLPGTAKARAETRRLVQWFDIGFEAEVGARVLRQKIDNRLKGFGPPDVDRVRVGLDRLRYHLDYVSYLAETRNWLCGERMTLADLTAAAHISCIDYLGDVPWRDFPHAKEWYARVKCRPAFRLLLADYVPGLPPPRHYADLDF